MCRYGRFFLTITIRVTYTVLVSCKDSRFSGTCLDLRTLNFNGRQFPPTAMSRLCHGYVKVGVKIWHPNEMDHPNGFCSNTSCLITFNHLDPNLSVFLIQISHFWKLEKNQTPKKMRWHFFLNGTLCAEVA